MAASTKPHVIIIGSGCSGLLVAQGLKKRGISFSIHDRVDPASRHRNWSMTVYWAQRYYPQLLPPDLFARLNEGTARSAYRYTDNEWLVIQNCKTGEVLKEWNSPYGIRVNRAGLRKLFSNGINATFGHELNRIEYTDTGVIAHFADGTSEAGTTLVGADGGNSFVRRQLLGDRGEAEKFPQYQMVNMSVKYTPEQNRFIAQNMAPYVDYGVHPKGIFFMVLHCDSPDENDYTNWVFHIALTFPTDLAGMPTKDQSNTERADVLRALGDEMSEPRRSILKWLPKGQDVPFDPVKLWEPTQWDNHGGRVTLAGDSSHAISFHRGQGWNNATTDCAHFVSAMENVATGKQSLPDAIGDYESEVIERGIREVSLSRTLTHAVHNWELFLNSPVIVNGGNETVKNTKVAVVV